MKLKLISSGQKGYGRKRNYDILIFYSDNKYMLFHELTENHFESVILGYP